MTEKDILAMVPGRELDLLIAKQFSEYPLCENKEHYNAAPPGEWCRKCQKYSPKKYSTDIAAVWEVYDWIGDNIGGIKVFKACDIDWPECCEIFNGEERFLAGGKTAPEAICKAALLAIMKLEG